MTKKKRQQEILEIVSAKRISTQEELTAELTARGFAATQPSVSRDIVELGIVKVDGNYTVPRQMTASAGPILEIDTAGENLIVVKTETGQAQPSGLTIDRAKLPEVVGTVAGDDTILIAVRNAAAQRLAIKKIIKLFSPKTARASSRAVRRPARKSRASAHQ